MGVLTWVHLSDWHQHGVDFDRDVVRDALVLDIRDRLRTVSPDLGKIDFVVFSGDLAFAGKAEEYRVAHKQFIDPVLSACGLTENNEPRYDRLFIVPGNHDVDRDIASLLRTDVRYFADRKRLTSTLTDEHARAVAFGPMRAYARFVRTDLSGAGCGTCTEYGFHARFQVDGISVCIVGLNSAWLCSTNRDGNGDIDDYGNIILGEMQLEDALRDAEEADLVIGIMHHPFQWLALKNGIDDRVKIRNRLMNECHLILHGHEHEPAVTVQWSTHGNCVIIPCGSAYDRRDPSSAMFANGYNFCTVNLEDGQSRVYLRTFDGDRRWNPDLRPSRRNADGSFVFQVHPKTTEDAPLVAKTRLSRTLASRPSPTTDASAAADDGVFVTSKQPSSVPSVPSVVLQAQVAGIAINVYVNRFGEGIRYLVNNRYIIAHAVSTSTPYSNVVSLSRGPHDFVTADIKRPAWKVWIQNDADASRLLTFDDTEQVSVGWHNFLLRWDHSRPLLELLLDGRVMIADAGYLEAWPSRFVTDIRLGAWPQHSVVHYVETYIQGWRVLNAGCAFDAGEIKRIVDETEALQAPKET